MNAHIEWPQIYDRKGKTGPIPATPEVFAAKYATKFKFRLLDVLDFREFLVQCTVCGENRRAYHRHGNFQGHCVCQLKKPTQSSSISRLGAANLAIQYKPDYVCLASKGTKLKSSFRHECGTVFKATLDSFHGSSVPCPACRILCKTHEEFLIDIAPYNITPVDRYVHSRTQIRFVYNQCGHEYSLTGGELSLGRIARCHVCYPNNRRIVKLQGKTFNVRSIPEVRFLQELHRRGYDMNRVTYEPRINIEYVCPETNRMRNYWPDFQVNNAVVEVKDKTSLGLRVNPWGKEPHVIFAENRAKFNAAVNQLDDFRVFLYRKGTFTSLAL